MTGTARAVALVSAVLIATVAARWIDPLAAIGDIKSDEATYVSMALSVAHDGDLSFEKADLDRFLAIYPRGPEGIFLKRAYAVRPVVEAHWPFLSLASTPVPTTTRLAYGKAFIYPVMAAPFVAIGGVGGMLVFNLVLLGISVGCAVRFCQAQCGRVTGALLGTGFIGASIVPVYGVFLMPEIFNFTLVFGAYFLWLYKEVAPPTAWRAWRRPSTDLAAGVLLGLATYSKPTHVLLVGPLVLVALLSKRWRHATAIALVAGATAGGLFTAHLFVTGEASYQGAATADGRKEFYDAFPFDAKGTTYDGYTAVEPVTNDTGSVNTTTTDVFVRLLPRNLWYFFAGRDAGLVPFFFPGVAILALWLVGWRRARVWQIATMLAWAATILAFLVFTPYTWNGAGGASGNRYFLSTYPTMLFLVPSATGLFAGIVATAVGVAFTFAMVASPVREATEPWLGVESAPFRWLPVELTLVTNLPVDLQPLRAHIPFLQDPVVLFTYLDDNTYFAEGDGLWIAGHAVTDIIIRTEQPILKLTLNITAKYVPNDVTATLDGHTERVSIEPGKTATLTFTPRPGVWAHASYGVVLHVTTTRGFVPSEVGERPGPGQPPDTRNLGVFIRPTFVVAEPPPGG